MTSVRLPGLLVLPIALCLGLPLPAAAQQAGENVVVRGAAKQDLYVAGGTVDVIANVDADVIAAGGQVSIDNAVSGDVMAVGGNVTVRAKVGDDVRLAGGNVTISGQVGDDAVAAGGHVLLAPEATVGGRGWFGGGTVQILGKIGKGVKAAGTRVVIGGDITGDVDLFADSVEIEPSAVIRGNLTYRARDEARIANGAKITGAVKRERLQPSEEARQRMRAFRHVARLALYISLMVTGVVLFLLFPAASVGAARTVNESPWKSLGLGLAFLAATPIVVALLFASLVGVWLALTLIAMYLVFLLFGFLTGVLTIGDWGLRWIGRGTAPTKGWRVVSIVVTLLLLWIVRFLPAFGGLIVFVVFVFGLGALTLYLWRRYVSA